MHRNKKNNQPSPSMSSRLELGIVSAWQNQAWWLWLLLPLSWLYGAIVYVRRYGYKVGLLKSYRAPVPILVVGNITIGGSGKTPLIIELVKFLKERNFNVGVISRGYGGDEGKMPALVDKYSNPKEVGDEPCLIARETNAPISVCPNRQLAIGCLLEAYPDIQFIIADDGLQHYKLQRDIEWIVVDSSRGFGNKQLLPTGFLREPISRLKSGTVIHHIVPSNHQELKAINSDNNNENDYSNVKNLTMFLQAQQVEPLKLSNATLNHSSSDEKLDEKLNKENNLLKSTPIDSDESVKLNLNLTSGKDLDSFKKTNNQKSVYAVSGIGYPKRFFNTLKALGYDIIEKPMPDHHQFVVTDFINLKDKPIIITSKDAVKIAPLVRDNKQLHELSIWVLPVRAVLSSNCYDTLLSQLDKLGVKP